ncbi:hypothetical protein DRO19_01505 [Candidatus Bathyarchaeota archaeon]|nr:MAG: hypothetical protein DRO19_01505 [Candidatus Bathyarchaeota archaeon]
MPNQVVYQTNADYEASYEKLVSSDIMIVEKTEKGLIWFRVKGTRTIFQLSPNGKLQVKWQNPEEKKVLLNIVKNILVSKNDQPLIITPLKQQVWIDYPPPPNFKLYWCENKTEYSRNDFNNYRELFNEAIRLYAEGRWLDSRDIIRALLEVIQTPEMERVKQKYRGVIYGRYFHIREIGKLISDVGNELNKMA